MAITRLLCDITPDEFPFISRKTNKDVLFPTADKVPSEQKPNWVENFWPLPSNNLGAVVEIDGFA